MEYINFKNQRFPIREVQLSRYDTVFIATINLNNLLMTKTGGYVSKQAALIDEGIFYFVEPSEIEYPNKKLIKLLREQTNA